MSELRNKAAEEFAKELRIDLAKHKCSIHPDHVSYLNVTPKETGFETRKEFCCQEFEDKIKIDTIIVKHN